LSGTLTVIAQPLSGWNSVTNPNDGNVGSDIETDAHLRARRQEELTLAGSTTASAIRADVIQQMQPPTTSVVTTGCTVLYNDTDVTDANGVPPHSIEVVARAPGATGDDDDLLAALILNNKAAGDGTNGTTTVVVTDSQGNEQPISFTRPADTVLTVVVTVVTDPTMPTPAASAIKLAMTDYADATYEPGVTVYYKRLIDNVFSIAGVVDWSSATVNGGTSNITIDVRHVATLDTGGITVVIT
jgi:uncharacterized phage protein gp47/JayE